MSFETSSAVGTACRENKSASDLTCAAVACRFQRRLIALQQIDCMQMCSACRQTPLDFVLNGVLEANGEREEPEPVGLELIEGYLLKVYRVRIL